MNKIKDKNGLTIGRINGATIKNQSGLTVGWIYGDRIKDKNGLTVGWIKGKEESLGGAALLHLLRNKIN